MVQAMVGRIPLRNGGFHILKAPFIMRMLYYGIVQWVMPKMVRERMNFIGYGDAANKMLHEKFGKENVLKKYGGDVEFDFDKSWKGLMEWNQNDILVKPRGYGDLSGDGDLIEIVKKGGSDSGKNDAPQQQSSGSTSANENSVINSSNELSDENTLNTVNNVKKVDGNNVDNKEVNSNELTGAGEDDLKIVTLEIKETQ